MYRYGFDRVGCLICPYASAYTNLLIKHYYDKQWERWRKVLENNYIYSLFIINYLIRKRIQLRNEL